jgi:PAS domain S-box-containing protein
MEDGLCSNKERLQEDEAYRNLRQSEELLRAALAASGTGIFRWDPHTGEFLEFDVNLKKLFGLASDQRVRIIEDCLAAVHPDDVPVLLANLERSRDGAAFEMEFRVVLPDGRVCWLYERARMEWLHGKPLYLVGSCTDITERKLVEETRLQLAAIVESSDDAIISKSLNGVITSWNAAATRIFGYSSEEMIGRSILTIIPPELHPEEDVILSRLRAGQRIDHYETQRLRKNGERFDVSLTISPVKDSAGRVIGVSKIARDITDRKRAEQALRTSEKLASVGRLAATVAHEVNNPLEAVINLVYLCQHDTHLPPQLRAYLKTAEEELARISQMTKQTLGFYRDPSQPVTTPIHEVLQQLLSVFTPKTASKRIDVKLDIRGTPEIVAYAGEIKQLFANLLSNSIDAVPVGGRIRIRVSSINQRHGKNRPGVGVVLVDSGPGISPVNLPQLFQPFFTTKKNVGTGLGLWLCRSIVQKHGGTIRIRSNATPGRSWTAISVFLPCQFGQPAQPPSGILRMAS